jgi:hypothetical protein
VARPLLTLIALAMFACTNTSSTTDEPRPSTPATTSAAPALPAGIPPSFEADVPAGDVPAAALIPLATTATGTWYAATDAGEAMVVAWQGEGEDPFRLPGGIVAWRRFADGGAPWRPVWGASFSPADRVMGIDGATGDVTGDGSEDLLVFAATGGTGACGSYRVIDLATAATVFERADTCDTTIEADPTVPGLVVTEAVFEAGDAHCCPSQRRETTLTYDGDGRWTEAKIEVIDL